MFFQKKEISSKEITSELVVLDFQNISSLTSMLNKYDFTSGLELRLGDQHISEQQVKEIFDMFVNFTGSKLVFNFTGCSFTGDIGRVISSFLNENYAPSELKFYFSYLDKLPGIEELARSLKYVPQKILTLDLDYGAVIDDNIVSLLIDAIENNAQFKKFSLNLDASDLSLNAAEKLSKCLEKAKHFILYASDCEIESQNPALFEKITQLTNSNALAVKGYLTDTKEQGYDGPTV